MQKPSQRYTARSRARREIEVIMITVPGFTQQNKTAITTRRNLRRDSSLPSASRDLSLHFSGHRCMRGTTPHVVAVRPLLNSNTGHARGCVAFQVRRHCRAPGAPLPALPRGGPASGSAGLRVCGLCHDNMPMTSYVITTSHGHTLYTAARSP